MCSIAVEQSYCFFLEVNGSPVTVTVDLIIMFMSKFHLTLVTACEKETCGNVYVHHLS